VERRFSDGLALERCPAVRNTHNTEQYTVTHHYNAPFTLKNFYFKIYANSILKVFFARKLVV